MNQSKMLTLTCLPYCIIFPFYNIETLKSNDVLYRCFLFEGYCVFWLGCGVSSSEQTRYQLKNVHNQITLDASRINWYVIDSSRLHSVDLISMTLSLQLYKHYLYTGYISAKRCTLMSSNLIHSFVITVEVAGKVLLYLKKTKRTWLLAHACMITCETTYQHGGQCKRCCLHFARQNYITAAVCWYTTCRHGVNW